MSAATISDPQIQCFTVGLLRVVCAPSPTDVVYAGIAVDAGTRDELASESGMAHLVEHMTFKGTSHRTSMQILNRMEAVGADLNAFTGKEETVYYSVFLKEHLARAIDLLLDLVFHSTYPQAELDKEVEVVCDEIESYNDTPAELIYDDFEALLFPGHPLGRNILGDATRLREYQSTDLQAFTRRLYHPEHCVLFVRGNVRPEAVRRLVARAMPEVGGGCVYCGGEGSTRRGNRRAPTASALGGGADTVLNVRAASALDAVSASAGVVSPLGFGLASPIIVNKPVHQAHVMVGAEVYPFGHPRYIAQALLGNILCGPGLNSRLALALRERRGLVYTVESTLNSYTDTCVWSVYFGCDPSDVKRCLRLVQAEICRLIDRPLSERALAAAKRQMKGQLGISYDNSENVAIGMAKRYLHDGVVLTPAQLFEQIDAVTPADLWQVGAEVFAPQRLTTLLYQP